MIEEKNSWKEVIETYDVGQLLELLNFTYGKILKDSNSEFEEYEGDYNPDEIYEVIQNELISLGKFDDFLENYSDYIIKKDESDPTHWRHRKKQQDELFANWDL
jgi:hypothetical protein